MTSPGQDLLTITRRPDTVFASGQGAWLTDEGGKRHLDLVQGWAVNSLGHSPALITEALLRQSQRLLNPSPAYYNRPLLDLAARLVGLSCFDRVFLASSGAEANEGAVKLARRWGSRMRGGAHEVIGFEQGFHGRTLAMMSASGKPGWSEIYPPMPTGFAKARLNDLASVERAMSPRTVAVMIEFVQGEAGVVMADPGFVRELRALTAERGVLLIADEVQTGIGRCGAAFAYELFGIEPDIMTLAKGLGGGVPLAALLCKEALNCFQPGDQGGTFCGNPLMAAVGLAVVDEICRADFLAGVRERAAQLSAGLRAISRDHALQGERGLGLLRALVLPADCADQVVAAAQALAPVGLLLNAPRPNLLRLMPALNISAAEVDEGLALLRRALAEVLG
ncbi:acetylornithine transaminase [Pelomonas aquatica]|jgi:acetylornithine/N-succinyldiaminopimelate aminotransferase|uniref:Diaminobutyrate--2-oxoglutarate transaminase n=1 Tax=Pelomonas aquatica TaxID=431058 RepID=A0A9X4R4Y0_9BURK|nr:acetylornithine transaminase [Pelomonas aquatica]MCY4756471.1 acetylornithine transaminase [Pelomonas aquatica]MDG0863085.1 acetylornithine transaminase [Pelomonas aquatica]